MVHLFDNLFKIEQPLGPATTPTSLQKAKSKNEFIDFYDDNNFLSREVLDQHPSAILGRRGSGKTAVLYHIRFRGGYTVVAKIDSSEIFTEISKDIETRLGGAGSVESSLVENSARAWKVVLQSTIICRVYQSFKNDSRYHDSAQIEEIREFLRKNGLINLKLYHAVWRALTRLFERYAKVKSESDEEYTFLSDFLDNYLRQEGLLDDAWEDAIDLLALSGSKALLLIDSLEQFPVHRYDMRAALSGLLHYVGELDREGLPVKVCVCFPAELHQELVDISDNPEKDFESVVTLHWDTAELFQMCGRRLQLFQKSSRSSGAASITSMPASPTRQDIWDFWHQILPKTVTNRVGIEEESIAYLSRHTQLLPRHLLNILNKIIMLSLKRDKNSLVISNSDIIEGVRLGEGLICAGIIDGFKQKFPIARDLVSLLVPNTPNIFTFNEFKRINEKFGYKIERDTFEVLEMFIRMGLVGRLVEETGTYYRARFDYTYNGQLPFSQSDTFCLHPSFSGQHKAINHREPAVKPVYPIEDFSDKRKGVGHLLSAI
tara:strand:- start:163 stop:1800 length:1638 start_codon:yes stop_codon:yes gene_type:complete